MELKSRQSLDDSGIAPHGDLKVPMARHAVLRDAYGRPLVRLIGFQPPPRTRVALKPDHGERWQDD